jgi:hypothetical protein
MSKKATVEDITALMQLTPRASAQPPPVPPVPDIPSDPAPAPGPAPAQPPAQTDQYKPWDIGDAFDFQQLFFSKLTPYRWQIEKLLQLSGYPDPYNPAVRVEPTKENPYLDTLCASNGSGKDQIVLCIWALYCVMCKRRFHWIGTSSSHIQLANQTWKHIKAGAESINGQLGYQALIINKFKIRCPRSGSEITLFRTDEGAKTEGWHPLEDGAGMAIVLNECKSLDMDIIIAFKRCHGYTHWLNISSPGDPSGYFYDRHCNPETVWPEPFVLGKWNYRVVGLKDCPHLQAEYERDVAEFGEEHPYIQQSYCARFVLSGALFIVPPDKIVYQYPKKDDMGMPRRAGIDLSLGGDTTVMSIWTGNYLVAEIELRESHEPTLTRILCDLIDQYSVPGPQIYADAGNMGTGIIQRIREAGHMINGVHNQGSPRNQKVYKNLGAELAMNFRRLVLDKVLNFDGISNRLRKQMGQRMYFYKDGKIQLEDKKEFKGRFGYSPDHFDAAILAHAGINVHVFKAHTKQSEPKPRTWVDDWKEIYGELDTRVANNGAYRTSGGFTGRRIGAKIKVLGQ